MTEVKARLVPVPPCLPLSRTLQDTRPRCVGPFKKMDPASTERSVSLLTEPTSWGQCPGTRNTRQTCVAPTTVSGSAPTVPGVTLFMLWTRWGTLQLNPQPRRRSPAPSNSSPCSGGTTRAASETLTASATLITPPTSRTCGQPWLNWTNISTLITAGSFLHQTTPPAVDLSARTPSLFRPPLHREILFATLRSRLETTWDCQSSADLPNVSVWIFPTRLYTSPWRDVYYTTSPGEWKERSSGQVAWPPGIYRICGDIRAAALQSNHLIQTSHQSLFPPSFFLSISFPVLICVHPPLLPPPPYSLLWTI